MKVVRYLDSDGNTCFGTVEDEVHSQTPPSSARPIEGGIFDEYQVAERQTLIRKLLYPVVPPMILGVGANYRELFTSTGRDLPEYPIVFYKLQNSLQHPNDPIVLPRRRIRCEQVKYEGELCVVIGREAKNVARAEALDYVFGYTIANDVSGVDWQGERVGMQWSKGKSFDTFCPFGPTIVTTDEIPDPASLRVVSAVDGVTEQNESVSEMCFDVPALIEFLSAAYTIPAGSIILTGTPPGARFVKPGEEVTITIDGIGSLSNPVVEEA